MTNHVHLLVKPSTPDSASRMMQSLGRSYVRYINTTYWRTGTLWEGRFKSSLVGGARYILTVSHNIELNPVRAAMVDHPGKYSWSSYRANGMGYEIDLLTPHPHYIELGRIKAARLRVYRQQVESGVCTADIDEIRICTNSEWIISSEKLKAQIAAANDRRITRARWSGDRKSAAFRKID